MLKFFNNLGKSQWRPEEIMTDGQVDRYVNTRAVCAFLINICTTCCLIRCREQ